MVGKCLVNSCWNSNVSLIRSKRIHDAISHYLQIFLCFNILFLIKKILQATESWYSFHNPYKWYFVSIGCNSRRDWSQVSSSVREPAYCQLKPGFYNLLYKMVSKNNVYFCYVYRNNIF